MSADQRQSPRAAIRDWLQYASADPRPRPANSPPKRHERKRRPSSFARPAVSAEKQPPESLFANHEGDRSKKRLHRKKSHKSRRETIATPPGPQRVTLSTHALEPRPGDPGFAEHLGLHAPFRNFKAQRDDLDAGSRDRDHQRKRRRRESSSSSYLELAENDGPTDNENIYHDSDDEIESPKQPIRGKKNDPPSSATSQASISEQLPSKKLSEIFERRPRHKTREDRYDLKDITGDKRKRPAKRDRKDGHERRSKRTKHKEKSGAALMHSFAPQNVTHERLTLPPAQAVGLFGRGRASSPVRRRGLPDLAFNEMKFLASRRTTPNEPTILTSSKLPTKTSRRKSTKAVDTEAEISRYFTSAKSTAQDPSDSRADQKQQESKRRLQAPPAYIDLPENPFLGFGSCGANSVSPVKRLDNRGFRELDRRLTRATTRPMGYFTWSQSGALSECSPRRSKQIVVPLESGNLANRWRQRSTSTDVDASKRHARSPRSTEIEVNHKATAGASPQSQYSAEVLERVESPPRRKKMPRSRSASRRHQTDRTQSTSESVPVKPVETIAEISDNEPSTKISKPGSRDQPPRDSNEGSAATNCNPQLHGMDVDTFKIGIGHQLIDQASLDPSDTIVDDLLSTCKCRRNTEHADADVESRDLEQSKNRLSAERPATLPSVQSEGAENFSRVKPNPEIRPPAARPVSSHESVDSRIQRGRTNPREPPRGFVQTGSRPSTVSSNMPRTVDFALGRFRSPQSMRANSRSAWNGYSTIYEQQQDASYHSMIANGIHGTTYNVANQEILAHSPWNEDVVPQPIDKSPRYPTHTEYGLEDRQAGIYTTQYEVQAEDRYQIQEELGEDPWQGDGAWQDIDYQEHSPTGAYHYSDPVERHEESASVHSEREPPELVGFWAPRMGY